MRRIDMSKVPEVISGGIKIRTVTEEGAKLSRVVFDVGARWSRDIGGPTDTDFCEKPHFGLILEGCLASRTREGNQQIFAAGDVMILPPGHDVWTVGSVPCVFVDFDPLP